MNQPLPDAKVLRDIYRRMTRIKMHDERIIAAMMAGKMAMPYYSARGQECIPAAISVHLTDDDYLSTIYRGGHDMLAKGVPAREYWAEIAGKATGTCKGKGGPMHITHPETGCMVTTGIVGASMPIACGMALASDIRGDRRITIANFGDGASNIGAFHESMNLAAVWQLPVIFVCQNNRFSEHTTMEKGTAVKQVAERGAAYNMPAVTVDGNDPLAVYHAAGEAIERARSGGGPTLIEAMTFRFNGHLVGDPSSYIPKDQMAAAKAADPYPRYRDWLLETGHAQQSELVDIDAEITREVDDAETFAMESAYPDPEELSRDVYAPA